jgi:hypothetical protein
MPTAPCPDIYHAALLVSPSRRGASLVVAFYAVSSHFYSFDAGFAYETLALTLGLGGLFLLRRAQLADYAAARRLFCMASLVLIATVVTHHATSWMVLAFLIAWAAMSRKGERKLVARAAVIMGVAVAIWAAVLATRIVGIWRQSFRPAMQSAHAFLAGTSQHHIFGSSAGTPPLPDWERVILVVYTLATTLAALACAWIMLSRAFHNGDRMLGLLGALNLAFPLTARLISTRASVSSGTGLLHFCSSRSRCHVSLIIQRHPESPAPGRRTTPSGPPCS